MNNSAFFLFGARFSLVPPFLRAPHLILKTHQHQKKQSHAAILVLSSSLSSRFVASFSFDQHPRPSSFKPLHPALINGFSVLESGRRCLRRADLGNVANISNTFLLDQLSPLITIQSQNQIDPKTVQLAKQIQCRAGNYIDMCTVYNSVQFLYGSLLYVRLCLTAQCTHCALYAH